MLKSQRPWRPYCFPLTYVNETLLCVGNVVGPLLFTTTDAPRYPHGFTAIFASACATVFLAIAYRFLCVWENKMRDEAEIMEGYEHAYDDDFTDRTVHLVRNCHSVGVWVANRSLTE